MGPGVCLVGPGMCLMGPRGETDGARGESDGARVSLMGPGVHLMGPGFGLMGSGVRLMGPGVHLVGLGVHLMGPGLVVQDRWCMVRAIGGTQGVAHWSELYADLPRPNGRTNSVRNTRTRQLKHINGCKAGALSTPPRHKARPGPAQLADPFVISSC